MKLVIVGGVAGGAAAATHARRASEAAEIVVFERGPDISFVNCGLPYYVGDVIDDRAKLLAATPEGMRQRYRLDVRTQTVVEAIDRVRKTVRARDLASGRVYDESYDKLILSPGASPIRPEVPGKDFEEVCTLGDLGDVDRIKAMVDGGVKWVVVGGGYIGLEMVENLVRREVATTLIQSRDQVLTLFDKEMTTPIAQELVKRGVELVLNEEVVGFARGEAEHAIAVEVESRRKFPADLVIVGIGVHPETWLAEGAGLAIGPEGGIQVNPHLQTSDPDIYGVGDAIEVIDVVLGGSTRVRLAGPANRQGRIAAEHLLGNAEARYRGSQGTIIVGVFGQTAAMTGASEQALRKVGRSYRKVYIHANNHSGYIPGAAKIDLKVLFDPASGRVLGGQAVGGGDGVDKRIDVLAMAIQGGLTVFDLEAAELAYAPQYGAANDLINMAGFTAAGLIRGDHPQIDVEAILDTPTDPPRFLLDVRSPAEFAAAHIPGATNIPVDSIRDRLADLPRDQTIAAYCVTGKRSYIATRILLQHGFTATNIGGGFNVYQLHHPGR